MPAAKYNEIYQNLKHKIENQEVAFQQLLPSENTLVAQYHCSRNTIRRAIGYLVSDGYVQTLQGKGVRNIYQRRPSDRTTFTVGKIESFRESANRSKKAAYSKVIDFRELTVDANLSAKTGFPVNAEIYYILRQHYMDDRPLILNHNYFLKEVVQGLTPEIATGSIYEYLENELGITIVNSKRIITVEKMSKTDSTYLDLGDLNCLMVVSSQTFNSDGIMFEYTQSRHRPDCFEFQDNAVR